MEFSPSPLSATGYMWKILVVGDITTGKTSFCHRYAKGEFNTNYKATIGLDMLMKVIELKDTRKARIRLWDIAGQERFGEMTRVFYKEAHAAIVLYDVAQPKTLEGALRWKQDIDAKLPEKIPVVLVANKIDLLSADQLPRLQEQVTSGGFISSVYCSVKDNVGIDDAITQLVEVILPRMPIQSSPARTSFQLTAQVHAQDEESCIPKCMK